MEAAAAAAPASPAPGLSKRRLLTALKEPPYSMRDVPKAKKDLEGSGINEVNDRDSGVELLGEMLMLCNEAARRFKHEAAPGTGSKPLALEYLADRMDTDDPLHGWVVRTRKEGWMQGFCTITNFTTWVRWFRWDSLAPQAGVFPSGDSSEDEEEADWLSRRVVDRDGSLATALNEQVHDGDPDGEGVIWPHLAEISLLGALGCGAWLLRLILEELEKPDSQYDYCVCQATDNAVPFYESLGFVRVGAVARYDYAPKACGDGAEAQEHLRRQVESRKMLKIWDAIATGRDEETGELHSTLFMSLPSKNLYPDYYDLIKHPVALNPIRKKIEGLKYESMEEFEMDLKLLFDNARLYNSSDSLVYADAERMQQVAFDKMGKQYFGKEPDANELLWMQFKVGFQLDVKDSRGHWYKADIVEMGVDRIKVHYLGWNQKWNEWHEKGNDDVQPLGTHTGGVNTTKRKVSSGMQYKVLRAANVREGFPLSSKICNALKAGELVTVVEKRSNDRGQVRVRIEKPCIGWASITSRDGATLLAPADPNKSSDSFVNETAKDPASKPGWVDPEKQGHIGVSSKTFWYQVKDGQTPREIATKHRCRAWDIVWLNQHLYPGLDATSKMKGGTKLRIPVVKTAAETKKAVKAAAAKASAGEARPSVYEASNDETPKLIANKLGIDVVDLVSANRSRYEGMTQTSRLMAGTKLKIPRGNGSADDDDEDWAGGAGVVSYRHWTFPNDPVELTYPSYMMARKLNKRKVAAPSGSILAELDKYIHVPPALPKTDDGSDDEPIAEIDLATMDEALTKEDAKRGMMQVWNAVVSCKDDEDQLAQHRVRSVFFRELPSRSMFPDYYQLIKQPLCLNQVRSRISTGKYDSLSAFMSELRTVFSNARQYNDPLAQIYHDAQIMECVAEEELQAWQDDWRYKQAQAQYEAQLPPKPKRASSSYLCFANSQRDSVAAELGVNSTGLPTVAKELGVRWNALTRRERRRYEAEAERDTQRYERELREYNRKVREIPKPPPKPHRKKKKRPPRPVPGGPLPVSPRGARGSPVGGRLSNKGPTNFFNKVVTVKGESLVGDYDYFFVLTYIPDLQWCRLAPLVQDGVFGRDRGERKGWPRWVLAKDEGSEMDVSAARCKVCRAKAVNRSSDADAEEWEIRDGEAERVLGMKRETKSRKPSIRKGGSQRGTRGGVSAASTARSGRASRNSASSAVSAPSPRRGSRTSPRSASRKRKSMKEPSSDEDEEEEYEEEEEEEEEEDEEEEEEEEESEQDESEDSEEEDDDDDEFVAAQPSPPPLRSRRTGGRRATLGGGRRAAAAGVGGTGRRRNMSRSARNNVTYNEDILSEMARPLYVDWRGEAGQDPNESGNDYKTRKGDSDAAARPATRKRQRR